MNHPLPLLVPIGIEALVVNSSDRRATKWSVSSRNFAGADHLLPIEPPPFARGNDHPRLGVTLSWILPDALTVGRWHGRGTDRELRYPYVPDRWLVVRTTRVSTVESEVDPVAPVAWVVESDHRGADGTNPIPQLGGGLHFLGRKIDLDDWDPDASTSTPSLTALGPTETVARLQPDGSIREQEINTDLDPAFAASVANVENVFSVHDDLSELYSERRFDHAAVLSYSVIGWYNDPEGADPMVNQSRLGDDLATAWSERSDAQLTADEWRAVMETLRWSVGGDDLDLPDAQHAATGDRQTSSTAVPTRTVCHGMVHGVRWTGRFRGSPQPYSAGAQSAFAGAAIRSRAGWRNPEYDSSDTGMGDYPDTAADLTRNDASVLRQPGNARGRARSFFPHVAVGSSATDALSALVEYLLGYEQGGSNPSDVAALFQALEHDLLDRYETPAGAAELRRHLHQDGFVSSPGGVRWEIVLRRPGDRSGDLTAPVEPTHSPEGHELLRRVSSAAGVDLVGALDGLNEAQRVLLESEAQLNARRRELYALWWKTKRSEAGTVGKASGAPTLGDLENLCDDAKRDVDALASETGTLEMRDRRRSDLGELLRSDVVTNALGHVLHPDASGAEPAEWLELLEVPAARFYAPADPVLVISGGRASPKHGGDGRFSDHGTLLVRFGRAADDAPGQTLRYDDGHNTIPSQSILAGLMAGLGVDRSGLPQVTADLLAEFLLLDAGSGDRPDGRDDQPPDQGWDGELSNWATPERVDIGAARRSLWSEPTSEQYSVAKITRDAGFAGVRPSPIAVERWSQPWRPLHVCWQANWYPATGTDDWVFDGSDLQWTGTGSFDHSEAVTLQGRSLLTSAPTGALSDSLDAILERIESAPPDPLESASDFQERTTRHAALSGKLAETKQRLARADLLAQSLTGFHDQLVQRDATQFYDPPEDEVKASLGDIPLAAPMPYDDGSPDAPRCFPLRGGHARIRRLWIVDAFGQVFDIIHERGQSSASFVPLRGRGLQTVGLTQRSDTQMLQFPPRFVQPSRLDFRFDTENDDGPVRGWLLPNHLDHAIQVFDGAGTSLGAIAVGHGGAAVWRAEVGDDSAPSTPDEIEDARLRKVVGDLASFGTAGLDDFLEAIDRTLQTTDPVGQRGSSMAVLVGRPMALVAARLAVTLDGPPLLDQRWRYTEKSADSAERTHEVTDRTVSVQLGLSDQRGDGTIGHFAADNRFHSVLDTPTTGASGYVEGAGSGNGPGVPVGFLGQLATPVQVLVLVDPRGSISATTGYLPTKSLQLPRSFVDAALANMDATFRIGPILSGRRVKMPLPSDISNGWSWIDKTGVNLSGGRPDGVWNHADVAAAAIESHLTEAPTRIREGWLRLSQAVNEPNEPTTNGDN